MRFIAKVLKDSLHEKFPDAGEDELLKVRGGRWHRLEKGGRAGPDPGPSVGAWAWILAVARRRSCDL